MKGHKFYNKSHKEQNRILLSIAVSALAIIGLSIMLSIYSGVYLLGVFIFIITLSIVAPFFDMPSLKKSGKVTYYSFLLIAEKPKNGTINIHGGTLFDYYFVIDRTMSGRQRTTFIMQQYIEGLLALMEENKHNEQLKIRATSYIINERTAKAIGFNVVETDVLQKVILIFNYFNIMISISIAKNRLSFPKLTQTKTFEANLSQLLEQKEFIEKINTSLFRS